jgi:predicted AAA+ superfamily ATPase
MYHQPAVGFGVVLFYQGETFGKLRSLSGQEKHLYYLRNKEGREVDFCITNNEDPALMVEVKWRDENVSPNFKIFKKSFPGVKMLQIVKELKKEKTFPDGIEIRSAHKWLSRLSLKVWPEREGPQ